MTSRPLSCGGKYRKTSDQRKAESGECAGLPIVMFPLLFVVSCFWGVSMRGLMGGECAYGTRERKRKERRRKGV